MLYNNTALKSKQWNTAIYVRISEEERMNTIVKPNVLARILPPLAFSDQETFQL